MDTPLLTCAGISLYACFLLSIAGWTRSHNWRVTLGGCLSLFALLLVPPGGQLPLMDIPWSAPLAASLVLVAALLIRASSHAHPGSMTMDAGPEPGDGQNTRAASSAIPPAGAGPGMRMHAAAASQHAGLVAGEAEQGYEPLCEDAGLDRTPSHLACRRRTAKTLYPAADSGWFILASLFTGQQQLVTSAANGRRPSVMEAIPCSLLLLTTVTCGLWANLRGLPGLTSSLSAMGALQVWKTGGDWGIAGGILTCAGSALALAGRMPGYLAWADRLTGWAACAILVCLFSPFSLEHPAWPVPLSVIFSLAALWVQVILTWLVLIRADRVPLRLSALLLAGGAGCLLTSLYRLNIF